MRARRWVMWSLLCLVALWLGGCDSSDDSDGDGGAPPFGGFGGGGGGGAGPPVTPAPVTPGAFTYTLTEGDEALPLWTTPITRKLRVQDRAPEETGSGLDISAARREFEVAQLALGPAEGEARVALTPFEGLGEGHRAELAVGGYVEGWLETLTPIESGASVALSPDHSVPIWLTVYVPEGAPAGIHEAALRVTRAEREVEVPVRLEVFDFDLPREIHFATQLNVSVSGLMSGGRSEEEVKDLLFEHRMTPKSVTWPSGFKPSITWDSDHNPDRCDALYDEPDEGAAYSIGRLAPKYILGDGWNDIGFPNAMLFQFIDNQTPRPDSFCGASRGDHHGSAAYNTAWGGYLTGLEGYLVDHGMIERGYYYVQNEPQDAEDEALAAHLCRLTKAAAPSLRIAISEEPKPSIAEDPGGACGYDIWIAHVRAYEEGYAWRRQREHGEAVWFYSLDHDPDPYFNPTRVDAPGIHQRIIPWAAWSHRITGWAYYDAGRFFGEGGEPGVRAALLREGFEDYEYLWLAHGGAHPRVDEDAAVDATAKSVAASMTSWTKDVDALMTLRRELGRFLGGEREALPTLEVEVDRPRQRHLINFQDPAGEPLDDPLVVDGEVYLKIGWQPYDEALGYGWSGEYLGTDILKYGYAQGDGFNALERSYIYDDYGRDNLFEFTLPPGTYDVVVCVGRADRAYEGQPHQVTIEGIKVVDDEPTTPGETLLVREARIDITDGALSMVVGGRSPSIDDWSYTFLDYLMITPVE